MAMDKESYENGVDDSEKPTVQMDDPPSDEKDMSGTLTPSVFKDRAQYEKAVLEAMNMPEIKSKADITITKIGMVSDTPLDDRFESIPSDIPKGALFIFGKGLMPMPPLKGSTTCQFIPISFTYYKLKPEEKPGYRIIILPYDCQESREFLRPPQERATEISRELEIIRMKIYKELIPRSNFYTLERRMEPKFSQWIKRGVQKMINREFRSIAEAAEEDRGLFVGSTLCLDPAVSEHQMYLKLRERLRKPSRIPIPSYQSYVGKPAQDDWMNIVSRAKGYDLANRETSFLTDKVDQIVSAVGEVDNIIVFGLGDAEKEKIVIESILKNQKDRNVTVHGIDVGLEFHLRALKVMRDIRTEPNTPPFEYRGYHMLFEGISEIVDYIRRRSKDRTKTLRFSLGNTFNNFRDPWGVFAKNMTKDDMLMVTTDIIPQHLPPDKIEVYIKDILARYQIPERRDWVLHPLYRVGFRGCVSADNVRVVWDEENSEVRLIYAFSDNVDGNAGIGFLKGEAIELYRSRKFDFERLAKEAERNEIEIKQCLKNEQGDFGCFILGKL